MHSMQGEDRATGTVFRRVWLAAVFGLAVAATAGAAGPGGELTIAAASDLNFAFKDVAAEFEKKTGRHVRLSMGSSGNFFSQIRNGAPFDLYFSADVRYPQKLEGSGHAVPGTLYKYAIGRIVLWAPRSSPLALDRAGMEVLQDPAIKRIAIANPKHAPYGRAAVAAMRHYKIHDRVLDKLVFGENVSQAAQFVESGAADVGIIALSLALAPAMKEAGRYWEIPADAHPPLEQGGVLLKRSRNRAAANSFLEFLKSDQGREIMRRYGFALPN